MTTVVPNPGKILVLSQRPELLSCVAPLMACSAHISLCSHMDEVFRCLEQDDLCAVLMDCDGDFEQAIERLTDVRGEHPAIKTGILAQRPWESALSEFFTAGIFNIINGTSGMLGSTLKPALELMSSPRTAMRSGALVCGEERMRSWEITDQNSKDDAREKFLAFMESHGPSSELLAGLHLIFDELVNNALYHAFRNADRSEKYSAESFKSLAPGEQILVSAASNGEDLEISISDNAGSLNHRKVAHSLIRHTTPEGQLDERGRGLFLTWNISDRMYVNLVHGALTKIDVCLGLTGSRAVKTLQINTG